MSIFLTGMCSRHVTTIATAFFYKKNKFIMLQLFFKKKISLLCVERKVTKKK